MSSVASSEVDKFSAMNQTWWDASKNPLIHMNAIRVGFIVDKVVPERVTGNVNHLPLSGKTALDIGCGGGLLSESLSRLGAKVTGIDPSETLIEAARAHSKLDSQTCLIDYHGGITAEDLAQSGSAGSFDLVCLLEVVEHATDLNSLLKAASNLVASDGTLVISTMNKTYKSYLLTIIGAEYVMGYLPIGTHDWNQYLSPSDVEQLLLPHGVVEDDIRGMVLTKPPVFGVWDWQLSAKDTDVNWIGSYKKQS